MAQIFPTFYNQTLRRYIVAFGGMFDSMVVQRLDSSGSRVQTLGVPISYAPKESFLARLSGDPNLTRPIAVQLPALSFDITGMEYDPDRRKNAINTIRAMNPSYPGTLKTVYEPVPWNIHFNLYIYTRNADDAAQLMEQILPFFGPEWTNTIDLIPSISYKLDIPTVINSVNMEDAYDGNFATRRALIYTLGFTMKGYFFGPVNTNGPRNKLIKKIGIDFHVPEASNTYSVVSTTQITDSDLTSARNERIIITPGLLANGSPTTNSAASISYQLISANTNYGFAVNNYFFTDGKRYDTVTGADV